MVKFSLFMAAMAAAFSSSVIATPALQTIGTVSMPSPTSNRAVIENAFADWAADHGSFYDLLTDEASVTIAGQSPHSGTLRKGEFLRERAKPFAARFSTPILPTDWKIWTDGNEVIVHWDSRAVACDGKPYINSYAYFITMNDGRVTALTMFLDMGAFDDVWNRCRPANQPQEQPR